MTKYRFSESSGRGLIRPGNIVRVVPSDTDDCVAVQHAGERYRVKALSHAAITPIVLVTDERGHVIAFREKDLEKVADYESR